MPSAPEIPIHDNQEPLLSLEGLGLILTPAYFEQGYTADPSMYMRKVAAEKLRAANNELAPFQLKVWDGLRSRDVQRKLYAEVWDGFRAEWPQLSRDELKIRVDTYVADPDDPDLLSPHLTGGAVDLTLADENGDNLDMEAEVDQCDETACALYYEDNQVNEAARRNRRLLRKAMTQAGFVPYEDEWWHFEYGTQLWAASTGNPMALYGEAAWPDPR